MNRLSLFPVSSFCLSGRSLWLCAPLLAALALPQMASAQPAPPPSADADAAAVVQPLPLRQVGDATHNLLALQSGGSQASATPRPISGDIAQLSYQRYLKSFETTIPDQFISTVKSNTSSGGR